MLCLKWLMMMCIILVIASVQGYYMYDRDYDGYDNGYDIDNGYDNDYGYGYYNSNPYNAYYRQRYSPYG